MKPLRTVGMNRFWIQNAALLYGLLTKTFIAHNSIAKQLEKRKKHSITNSRALLQATQVPQVPVASIATPNNKRQTLIKFTVETKIISYYHINLVNYSILIILYCKQLRQFMYYFYMWILKGMPKGLTIGPLLINFKMFIKIKVLDLEH